MLSVKYLHYINDSVFPFGAMIKIVPYGALANAELVVDAVYEGGPGSQISAEALSSLLPGVGNQGGFRASGRGSDKKFVIIYRAERTKTGPTPLMPIRDSSRTSATTNHRGTNSMILSAEVTSY